MDMDRRMLPVQGPAQLWMFTALPVETGLRDQQDLMSYPFFSLSKGARMQPIQYAQGPVSIEVKGVPSFGIATIWDADVLIWAASQLAAAMNQRLPTSPRICASLGEILRFTRRGTSLHDYQRLRAALNRLQASTVMTTLRAEKLRHQYRFSWIAEWQELAHENGHSAGIEIVLADWFYAGALDESSLLSLHPDYFRLTGGLQRWLYRLVRKHGGHQRAGWRFPLRQLHARSGSLQRYSDFSLEIRRLITRPLLDYQLWLERDQGSDSLCFRPVRKR